MAQVACVGILVADVMARPVDKIPGKGLLEQVSSIEMYTGGNAMTATVNLQTLGTQSAIVGKVGADVFGDFLEKEFQKQMSEYADQQQLIKRYEEQIKYFSERGMATNSSTLCNRAHPIPRPRFRLCCLTVTENARFCTVSVPTARSVWTISTGRSSKKRKSYL